MIDAPGRPRMIHTPGHTAGECMLHLEDRQVLIGGDAIVALILLTGEHLPPRVPYRLVNDDDRRARRSIAGLEGLGTYLMLPGHGRSWRGTVEQVVEAGGCGPPARGVALQIEERTLFDLPSLAERRSSIRQAVALVTSGAVLAWWRGPLECSGRVRLGEA